MELDLRLLGLAERLVVALEALAGKGAKASPAREALRPLCEPAEEAAAFFGEAVPVVAPIAAEVAAAEAGFVASAKKKRSNAGWTPERRAAQAERIRRIIAQRRDSGTMEGASPPAAANGAALPIVQTQAAAAPAAVREQAGGSPALSIITPPALHVPRAAPPRAIAVPFANVRQWASERGIRFESWDDLGEVNRHRLRLQVPQFEREMVAR